MSSAEEITVFAPGPELLYSLSFHYDIKDVLNTAVTKALRAYAGRHNERPVTVPSLFVSIVHYHTRTRYFSIAPIKHVRFPRIVKGAYIRAWPSRGVASTKISVFNVVERQVKTSLSNLPCYRELVYISDHLPLVLPNSVKWSEVSTLFMSAGHGSLHGQSVPILGRYNAVAIYKYLTEENTKKDTDKPEDHRSDIIHPFLV